MQGECITVTSGSSPPSAGGTHSFSRFPVPPHSLSGTPDTWAPWAPWPRRNTSRSFLPSSDFVLPPFLIKPQPLSSMAVGEEKLLVMFQL